MDGSRKIMGRKLVTSYNEKTTVMLLPNEDGDQDCFTGVDTKTGEISCLWERNKFDFSVWGKND